MVGRKYSHKLDLNDIIILKLVEAGFNYAYLIGRHLAAKNYEFDYTNVYTKIGTMVKNGWVEYILDPHSKHYPTPRKIIILTEMGREILTKQIPELERKHPDLKRLLDALVKTQKSSKPS